MALDFLTSVVAPSSEWDRLLPAVNKVEVSIVASIVSIGSSRSEVLDS